MNPAAAYEFVDRDYHTLPNHDNALHVEALSTYHDNPSGFSCIKDRLMNDERYIGGPEYTARPPSSFLLT